MASVYNKKALLNAVLFYFIFTQNVLVKKPLSFFQLNSKNAKIYSNS